MGYPRNDRDFHGGRRDYRDRDDRDHRTYGYGGGSDRASDFGYGRERDYRDQYGSFNEGGYGRSSYGRERDHDQRSYGRGGGYGGYGYGAYGANRQRRDAPADYDYDDRGFFSRAGDEVRSWFGDEEAERRREADARYDERYYRSVADSGSQRHDPSYSHWRNRQIADLDRDYDEYRRENQTQFDSEFGTWRSRRTEQRSSLSRVAEHMEVVGSDGGHIGTVDKVRGDRIVLTKTDADAGGHHHSIPSAWITSVDDKVTISKTADQAQSAWRDEERRSALFGGTDADSRESFAYARYMFY